MLNKPKILEGVPSSPPIDGLLGYDSVGFHVSHKRKLWKNIAAKNSSLCSGKSFVFLFYKTFPFLLFLIASSTLDEYFIIAAF